MIYLIKSKMKANKENKKLTAEAEIEMEMNLAKHYLVHFFGILLGRG